MEDITKVIIADDHVLFADGLEQILQSLDGFVVLAKVIDGKQLIQKLNTLKPDMILLDINMPYLNGMDAAQEILQAHPEIKIVFISMYYSGQVSNKAQEMGAKGFLMKDVTAAVLKEAILNIKNNVSVFLSPNSPERQLVVEREYNPYRLSPREIDIIKLIKEGKATKQIAEILELSVYTIETHRKNIGRKLKVQSTAELIALVHQLYI